MQNCIRYLRWATGIMKTSCLFIKLPSVTISVNLHSVREMLQLTVFLAFTTLVYSSSIKIKFQNVECKPTVWPARVKLDRFNKTDIGLDLDVTLATPVTKNGPILYVGFYVKRDNVNFNPEPELTFNSSICDLPNVKQAEAFLETMGNCTNFPKQCPPEGLPKGFVLSSRRCLLNNAIQAYKQYAFENAFKAVAIVAELNSSTKLVHCEFSVRAHHTKGLRGR